MPTSKLSDAQLLDLAKRALAALAAGNSAAAEAAIRGVPRSQLDYFRRSLAGAIADKKAAQAAR
jgi:hypothetical protein